MELVDRSSVPTSGYWKRGSVVINNDWAAGEALYWVCTVTGEPGTWVAVYTTQPETTGAGASNGATVSAAENSASAIRQTTLTLTATPVSVADADAFGSVKVYDFPEGRILVLGVTASVQWGVTLAGAATRATTINNNASLTWSLGTVAASNATLASTMVDLLPKTTKVLSAATTALNTASTGALAASAHFDGTGTAKDVYLNVGFETDTDIDGDGGLAATGTVTITWVNLGDY